MQTLACLLRHFALPALPEPHYPIYNEIKQTIDTHIDELFSILTGNPQEQAIGGDLAVGAAEIPSASPGGNSSDGTVDEEVLDFLMGNNSTSKSPYVYIHPTPQPTAPSSERPRENAPKRGRPRTAAYLKRTTTTWKTLKKRLDARIKKENFLFLAKRLESMIWLVNDLTRVLKWFFSEPPKLIRKEIVNWWYTIPHRNTHKRTDWKLPKDRIENKRNVRLCVFWWFINVGNVQPDTPTNIINSTKIASLMLLFIGLTGKFGVCQMCSTRTSLKICVTKIWLFRWFSWDLGSNRSASISFSLVTIYPAVAVCLHWIDHVSIVWNVPWNVILNRNIPLNEGKFNLFIGAIDLISFLIGWF